MLSPDDTKELIYKALWLKNWEEWQ